MLEVPVMIPVLNHLMLGAIKSHAQLSVEYSLNLAYVAFCCMLSKSLRTNMIKGE